MREGPSRRDWFRTLWIAVFGTWLCRFVGGSPAAAATRKTGRTPPVGPRGPAGGNTITTYHYDGQGKLIHVTTGDSPGSADMETFFDGLGRVTCRRDGRVASPAASPALPPATFGPDGTCSIVVGPQG